MKLKKLTWFIAAFLVIINSVSAALNCNEFNLANSANPSCGNNFYMMYQYTGWPPEPTVNLTLDYESDLIFVSGNATENRERHEFSHHIMYDWMESFPKNHGDNDLCSPSHRDYSSRHSIDPYLDCNHDGYLNHCTSDSWVEGFAMFMPLVMSDIGNESKPDEYAEFGSFESERWVDDLVEGGYQREDIAVAALLWDLYDGSDTNDRRDPNQDDDDVEMSVQDLWSIFTQRHPLLQRYDLYGNPSNTTTNRYIYYVTDIYDVLANSNNTDLDEDSDNDNISDLDEIFINHGFYMDSNANGRYDVGETVGQGDASRPNRY